MARQKINVLSLTVEQVNFIYQGGVDLELEGGRYAVIKKRTDERAVS